MMPSTIRPLLLTFTALLIGGCGMDDEDAAPDATTENVTEAQQRIIVGNGQAMNGTIYNGTIINGVKSNGVKSNGVKSNGVKSNGVKSNGTELIGEREDTGATIEGLEFQGAEMDAMLGNGETIALHIEEISTTDIPGMMTYRISAGGTNICGTDTFGSPVKAFPLNGRWDYLTGAYIDDPNAWTIACRGAALAKCFEMGYSRFGTNATTGVANAAYHEACVRMIRADYCGNGNATTHDGTLVDIWDKGGVQERTTDPLLKLEAEWGPYGATCINHTRWDTSQLSFNVPAYVAATCPSRNVACGTGWGSGILRNASGQNDHSSAAFNAWSW